MKTGETTFYRGSSVVLNRFQGHAVVMSEADEPFIVLPGTPPNLVL